jgi:hypothetical protein
MYGEWVGQHDADVEAGRTEGYSRTQGAKVKTQACGDLRWEEDTGV